MRAVAVAVAVASTPHYTRCTPPRESALDPHPAMDGRAAPRQDFLFVDASKSARSSRQGRRSARSFVMQKARRERHWSTSKQAARSARGADDTTLVARSPQTVEAREAVPLASPKQPANAMFDPFGSFPVEMNAGVSELLVHCA